ncbi:hypothetical protein ACLB9X_03510 [Streptomyces sp. 5K101]|uniref:hypothetical protein n=1 Tax=Streptomyces sp. 5K101 TaxID=3390037 RepID=UPI0039759290
MNRGKPPVSRRSVLTGFTAALASTAFVSARPSPARAATAASTPPPPPHPPYHSIVGLL